MAKNDIKQWLFNEPPLSQAEYRQLVEARFIELGRAGANANVKHPDRKQWERLRAEITSWKRRKHKSVWTVSGGLPSLGKRR
jgi:hypothetical protein